MACESENPQVIHRGNYAIICAVKTRCFKKNRMKLNLRRIICFVGKVIGLPFDILQRVWRVYRWAQYLRHVVKTALKERNDAFLLEQSFIASTKSISWIPFPYVEVLERKLKWPVVSTADGFPCVLHDGKRLFFQRKTSLREAAQTYRNFVDREGITGHGCLEKNPHNYQSQSHFVETGDVLVDIGCSEALFSLDNIEKVSRAFLFEADPGWREPLEKTFGGRFKDKVVITNKFVGDGVTNSSVRLDEVLCHDGAAVYFIKMDIEGAERVVLETSREFLMQHKVKLSCCVYHRQDDAEYIQQALEAMGFSTAFSDGYMLPICDELKPPYFRKGVIYARNF